MPDQAATIATAISDIMSEGYGHGPSSARAIIHEGVVVVLLEETFSNAELKLIELGQAEDIKHIRRSWQTSMEEDFREIVERVTSRQVRAFISDTDVAAELSVELFVLGEDKTDMDGFEAEADAQTDEIGESERQG